MVKVILIHGNGGGTGSDCWLPYVKQELEKHNIAVIAPTFPDNYLARSSYWIPFLKNDLQADENTIVVGFSSGAECAMRFAEKYALLGTVLVAACHTDLGFENEKISGYYDTEWQWNTIKNNQQWIVQFASTDDPFIPIEEAHLIHEMLETDYHEYTNRGHFNTTNQFPECVTAILNKLKSR